ncbi:MAG TPA: DUF3047 domain-containing protein [Usitatibacter sp.]|nr:DUF3047 domain-containing protein [Usitatibacter sp.]
MRRAIAPALILFASLAHAAAADESSIAKFSTAAPGAEIPAGWEKAELPYGKKSEFKIVEDGGKNVLQVRADGSFGSLAHRLAGDAQKTPILEWRWKVDRVVEKAEIDTKSGEDFAARVYVAFDIPESELSKGDRTKLKIARAVQSFVPAAAICYVWDNKHPVGASMWSPYFGHVRTVVVESGGARAGQWVAEKRDIEADFLAAFGAKWKGKIPAITGVVVGNDTDQTGETVTASFGDLSLEPRK